MPESAESPVWAVGPAVTGTVTEKVPGEERTEPATTMEAEPVMEIMAGTITTLMGLREHPMATLGLLSYWAVQEAVAEIVRLVVPVAEPSNWLPMEPVTWS